jgi:hypothetical protein
LTQVRGLTPLLFRNATGPACSHLPRRDQGVWQRPLSGQGKLDAPPHFRFIFGLGGEEDPHVQEVSDRVGLHEVRGQGARRVVVPVPAQRDRD